MHMFSCTRMHWNIFSPIRKCLYYLRKLHLHNIPICGPIVQVSGSPHACILELFSVLYLYDFMTKNSKICEYQPSQVHWTLTIIFNEEHILAQLNRFIVCLIITCMSIFQCVGSVQVSFMEYCCTIWVLLHRSIMGLYAYVQLYQNALKHFFTNQKVSVLPKKTTLA